MGLDTTHDCWHGSYGAFMRWRRKLAEVAGYGDLDQYEGYSKDSPGCSWPTNGDVLQVLLHHSDCDGEIEWRYCESLAARLEELLPALTIAGDGGGHIGDYTNKTKLFIYGLREAHRLRESVEFH